MTGPGTKNRNSERRNVRCAMEEACTISCLTELCLRNREFKVLGFKLTVVVSRNNYGP